MADPHDTDTIDLTKVSELHAGLPRRVDINEELVTEEYVLTELRMIEAELRELVSEGKLHRQSIGARTGFLKSEVDALRHQYRGRITAGQVVEILTRASDPPSPPVVEPAPEPSQGRGQKNLQEVNVSNPSQPETRPKPTSNPNAILAWLKDLWKKFLEYNSVLFYPFWR